MDAGDSKLLWNMVAKTMNYKNNNSGFFKSIDHDNLIKLSEINASFAAIATDPDYDPNIINEIVNAGLLNCKTEVIK